MIIDAPGDASSSSDEAEVVLKNHLLSNLIRDETGVECISILRPIKPASKNSGKFGRRIASQFFSSSRF
jgi:hypothetical protein